MKEIIRTKEISTIEWFFNGKPGELIKFRPFKRGGKLYKITIEMGYFILNEMLQ